MSVGGRGRPLDCLKYLHETAKAPWDEDAVREARKNYHPECVQYCLDNDCPLPYGWRYEDGELYVSESESESNQRIPFGKHTRPKAAAPL